MASIPVITLNKTMLHVEDYLGEDDIERCMMCIVVFNDCLGINKGDDNDR